MNTNPLPPQKLEEDFNVCELLQIQGIEAHEEGDIFYDDVIFFHHESLLLLKDKGL